MGEQGWMVNKKHGYISDITWEFTGETSVLIHHRRAGATERLRIENGPVDIAPGVTYENDEAWIFLHQSHFINWLNDEYSNLSVKTTHCLRALAKHQPEVKFIANAKWPKNFVVGYTPSSYTEHCTVHLPRCASNQLSVDNTLQELQQRLGAPSSAFSNVWLEIDYSSYRQMSIKCAVTYQELHDYYARHCPQTQDIKLKIQDVLGRCVPDGSFEIEIHRKYRYYYNDGKHLVDLNEENWQDSFMNKLGESLKSKLSSAVKNSKHERPNYSTCCYLGDKYSVARLTEVQQKMSIVLPYNYLATKCYEVNEPIKVMLWARPDNHIIVDSLIPVSSAKLIKIVDTVSGPKNVLDSMF